MFKWNVAAQWMPQTTQTTRTIWIDGDTAKLHTLRHTATYCTYNDLFNNCDKIAEFSDVDNEHPAPVGTLLSMVHVAVLAVPPAGIPMLDLDELHWRET